MFSLELHLNVEFNQTSSLHRGMFLLKYLEKLENSFDSSMIIIRFSIALAPIRHYLF